MTAPLGHHTGFRTDTIEQMEGYFDHLEDALNVLSLADNSKGEDTRYRRLACNGNNFIYYLNTLKAVTRESRKILRLEDKMTFYSENGYFDRTFGSNDTFTDSSPRFLPNKNF